MINDRNFFESSDLSVVAALCCHGLRVHGIDNTDKSNATFFIKRSKDLDKHLQQYFSGLMRVEPLNYSKWLKTLKTRIYHT